MVGNQNNRLVAEEEVGKSKKKKKVGDKISMVRTCRGLSGRRTLIEAKVGVRQAHPTRYLMYG